jgi:sugar lactone lactonase YvrE
VLAPDGVHIGFVRIGAVPTNCAFADSTLYVTDGGHEASTTPGLVGVLWAVDVEVAGQPLFPGNI